MELSEPGAPGWLCGVNCCEQHVGDPTPPTPHRTDQLTGGHLLPAVQHRPQATRGVSFHPSEKADNSISSWVCHEIDSTQRFSESAQTGRPLRQSPGSGEGGGGLRHRAAWPGGHGKGRPGNKDERFDAFVLTDTLRTDRARLPPLVPDSPATVALRQTCRARKDLVAHRVAVANQLRAHLQIVFPGGMSAEPPGEPVRLSQSHDGQGITPLP